jgi:hypothetical protein
MSEQTFTFTVSNPTDGKRAIIDGWVLLVSRTNISIIAPRDVCPSRIIQRTQFNGQWQEGTIPMCPGPNNTWEIPIVTGELTVVYTSRGTNFAF